MELVQRLIVERYKVIPSKSKRAPGIGSLTSTSGRMDTQTAFEIYIAGDHNKLLSYAEEISPAKGGTIF